jgi:hypothetical protein
MQMANGRETGIRGNDIMTSRFIVAGLLCGLAVSGCTVAPLNFTPANVAPASRKHNAALVSTNVTIASKQELKGKIKTAGIEADVASLWKSSVDDAIIRMAIFHDDSPKKLSLVVKILQLDMQSLGSDTKTTARYELIDRDTGTTVFRTDVQTDGKASDYAGVDRTRKSSSRSVQANIEEFLRQLAAVDLH